MVLINNFRYRIRKLNIFKNIIGNFTMCFYYLSFKIT